MLMLCSKSSISGQNPYWLRPPVLIGETLGLPANMMSDAPHCTQATKPGDDNDCMTCVSLHCQMIGHHTASEARRVTHVHRIRRDPQQSRGQ
jgi:hypothetical protein